MEPEESTFLTSDYTMKLQQSRQYGNGRKNRNTDQWNKTESPEINPCTYVHLTFDKQGKNIQLKTKDCLFNKQCWKYWTTTCRRMKLEHILTRLSDFTFFLSYSGGTGQGSHNECFHLRKEKLMQLSLPGRHGESPLKVVSP